MDNFVKEKIMPIFNYFVNQTQPPGNENNLEPPNNYHGYELIKHKRKAFYFSKYTIDTNEIFLIFKTIKTIKESLFKTLLDAMKYCCLGITSFNL